MRMSAMRWQRLCRRAMGDRTPPLLNSNEAFGWHGLGPRSVLFYWQTEVGFFWSPGMEVKDSNGNVLKDGDSVILIKDLKVKGAGQTLKRGTKISSIRLTDNEDEVDCRHDKIKGLVLRVEFLKKA